MSHSTSTAAGGWASAKALQKIGVSLYGLDKKIKRLSQRLQILESFVDIHRKIERIYHAMTDAYDFKDFMVHESLNQEHLNRTFALLTTAQYTKKLNVLVQQWEILVDETEQLYRLYTSIALSDDSESQALVDLAGQTMMNLEKVEASFQNVLREAMSSAQTQVNRRFRPTKYGIKTNDSWNFA